MTVSDRAAVLRQVGILADVPERDLLLLASMAEVERFRPTEPLWDAGDVADRIHIVASGAVVVRLPGRGALVTQLGPGEIVGELAMFAQARRSAGVVAEVETVVLSLGYEPFREFLRGHPEACLALLGRIVRRFLERERAWAAPDTDEEGPR